MDRGSLDRFDNRHERLRFTRYRLHIPNSNSPVFLTGFQQRRLNRSRSCRRGQRQRKRPIRDPRTTKVDVLPNQQQFHQFHHITFYIGRLVSISHLVRERRAHMHTEPLSGEDVKKAATSSRPARPPVHSTLYIDCHCHHVHVRMCLYRFSHPPTHTGAWLCWTCHVASRLGLPTLTRCCCSEKPL